MAIMAERGTLSETARAESLQDQYEGAVLSLVIRDLAVASPASGEDAVMEVVTKVWTQAKQHAKTNRTSWAHLSWFVQNAIAQFVAGLRPQMAGC
ncbi:hypothetical protein ACIA8O_38890 [Kitasatospora sp. NPDC051853]|uniref:hypothetical protein n=1 Tax=Kitasatospora sp. NPDC051853 TaxID=3364058 RepID=UPI0037B7D6E2